MLLELALAFALPSTNKTQCFVHLSFNMTLHLMIGISNDFQNLLKYFNGTAAVTFFRTLLSLFGAGCATVVPKENIIESFLEN